MSNIYGQFGDNVVTIDTDQDVIGKKRFLNADNEFDGTLVQPTILAGVEIIYNTEISFLSGLQSNIQSQFDNINASTATNIATTSDNTSGTYYIPFSKTAAGTSTVLYLDDTTGPLSYNPSTSTLTASVFVGAFTGNASTATNQSGGTVSATTGAFSGALTLSVPPVYTFSTVPTYTSGQIGYTNKVSGNFTGTLANSTWTAASAAFAFPAVGVYMVYIQGYNTTTAAVAGSVSFYNVGLTNNNNSLQPPSTVDNTDGFSSSIIGGYATAVISSYLLGNTTKVARITSLASTYYIYQNSLFANLTITGGSGSMYLQYTRIA